MVQRGERRQEIFHQAATAAKSDAKPDVKPDEKKPDADKAAALLLQGDVLWNAGIFLCRADTLLNALAQHAPDILQSCQAALTAPQVDGRFVRPAPGGDVLRTPEVLLSGHHANIATWRREQAERVTRERRPDLWSRYAAKTH